jgi:hypothetical protein
VPLCARMIGLTWSGMKAVGLVSFRCAVLRLCSLCCAVPLPFKWICSREAGSRYFGSPKVSREGRLFVPDMPPDKVSTSPVAPIWQCTKAERRPVFAEAAQPRATNQQRRRRAPSGPVGLMACQRSGRCRKVPDGTLCLPRLGFGWLLLSAVVCLGLLGSSGLWCVAVVVVPELLRGAGAIYYDRQYRSSYRKVQEGT